MIFSNKKEIPLHLNIGYHRSPPPENNPKENKPGRKFPFPLLENMIPARLVCLQSHWTLKKGSIEHSPKFLRPRGGGRDENAKSPSYTDKILGVYSFSYVGV